MPAGWIVAGIFIPPLIAAAAAFLYLWNKVSGSNKDLEQKLEDVISDLREKEGKLSEITVEKSGLQKELNRVSEDIQKLQAKELEWVKEQRDYEVLQGQFSFLENRLKEVSDSKEREIKNREEKILNLANNNASLNKELDIRSRDLKELKSEKEEWEKQKNDYVSLQTKLDRATEDIQKLQAREQEWMFFSRGLTLEQVKVRKSEADDRRSRIKGDTENVADIGAALEDRVEDIISSLFPRHLDYMNMVHWERQKITEARDRADFVMEFSSHKFNGSLRVIIECKSQIDDDDSEYMIIDDPNQEEERLKKGNEQIKKGIKQLIKYSEKDGGNLGLILTTCSFNKGEFGFNRLSWEEYGIEKQSSYPEIFLVSLEGLKTVLSIIHSLVHACEPTVSLIESSDAWFKDSHYQFLQLTAEHTREAKKQLEKIQKRSLKAFNYSKNLNDSVQKLYKVILDRENTLLKCLNALDYSSHKETLKLEDKSEIEVDPEDEDEGGEED